MTEEEKKALEDAKAETDKLKAEIAAKDEELKKLHDKDMNFGKVRKSEEEKEAEIEKLKKGLADMETKNISEKKEKYLRAFAGTDNELKKTISLHYEKLGREAKTEEEIQAAMKDAYLLSTKAPVDKNIINRVSGGDGGVFVAPTHGSNDAQVDQKTKEWADEFNKHGANIKEDDLKNPKFKVKKGQSAESDYQL